MKTDIFFFFFFFLSITSISAFPLFPNSTTDADDHSDDPWHYYFTNLTGCHAGDHAQGLAKLKQYFHHFGYIPDDQNPSYNFTDDFDDSLESALKTYQLNFNLDPTGTLDEPTLSQITRPRCGVADIINGSTTMKSGKKPSGLHSVAHYAFFPGQPRWPQFKHQLTYAFFPGNQLKDSVKSVFTRAFSRWSAVTPLTFTETQDYSNSDLKIGFFVGNHGDGEPFDGVLGTLAHAFSPPDGRFHLDGAEKWVVDGSLSGSDSVDLESVAVHEIGHLLGLGHTSVEEAIMFPTISSGKKKTELAKDDVDGIQQLYGGNPNYAGGAAPATTTPSSQERERSDTSGGGQGLVGGGVWWSTLVAMSLVGILFIF